MRHMIAKRALNRWPLSSFFVSMILLATSAICVTGLVVVDTGSFFTLGGQLVILGLIQAGGLGIMTFSVFFWRLLGREVFLKVLLMFIGASPGSCGGGIKTTNLAILLSLGYN